jgi:ubiquinone/menaquinone biosynthesis C-methylase UbiE
MTWTYSDDYYRGYTRTTWNESAPVWVRYLYALEPYRRDLVAAAQLKPGERVLDIATGSGEPALSMAKEVGPRGRVVGVDLSEQLIGFAQRAAKERSVANVEFEVMDAEKLSLPDASFDAAVSAFGFQIITDPAKAAREAHRVLKPGGRVAVSVWGPAERCQALHIMVGPMLENAEPDETGYLPTPYEMGGPGEMVAFLADAGFKDGKERRTTHEWTFQDADHFLEFILKGTPLGHSLREEEPAVQEEVLRKTRANLARWTKPDGRVAAPAECVVVTARK